MTRNALKGQQQLAQGSALGWKWEQTNALQGQKHKTGKGFCTYSASFSCAMPTQGAALGYERVGLAGRSLSERVNCDIIATPLTQSRFR